MKRRFAFLGSYSALVGFFGLLSLIAAALVRFFLPKLHTSVWSLIALGTLLVLLSILTAVREFRSAISAKRTRYGTNTLIMVFAFIGTVVMANLIAASNRLRFDVTAEGQFTLTSQTQRVLTALKQPVRAIGFFPETSQYQAARRAAEEFLAEYRYHTHKIDYRFVDPDVKPAIAKQYNLNDYGMIVFESGGRTKGVNFLDQRVFLSAEQYFTEAVLEVTGQQQKKIYFLHGHGESDIKDTGNDGYSLARQGLVQDLYHVGTLELTVTPKVPEDCAVLVVAGPKNPFRTEEVSAINTYLEKFGKILILVDPNPPVQINRILADWGITIGRGKIIEEGAYLPPEKATPAILKGTYPPVAVTKDLDTTYFPEATAVILTEPFADVIGEEAHSSWPLRAVSYGSIALLPMAVTTPASWLESDSEKIQFDGSADIRGPFALGCMVIGSAPFGQQEKSKDFAADEKLTRLVVIGDSNFASNQHYQNGSNSDLFLNAVNWLAEEEQLISIRPKPFMIRRLVVGQDGLRFIRYSTIILFPLCVLIVGGIVYWRRR